jgi:hypothetical protein
MLKQCVDELLKTFPWIFSFEKKLLDQIIIINKNEYFRRIMHGRGDSNYQTRWYWRVDISDYLCFSYENYKKIFNNEAVSLNELRLYGLLFEPLMGLHRLCEMNSSCITMMFSFDLQFFEYIEKLLGLFK